MIYKCKPERVRFYNNVSRKTAAQIKAETGCDVVFNGSLYDLKTFIPCCDVRIDGKWLSNDQYTYFGYGWSDGELPRVIHSDDAGSVDNYISCIWAIHEGARQILDDNAAGIGGRRGRTAFGFDASGGMVILCTSDSVGALTLAEARDELYNNGCVSGIILDGGGSSQIDTPDCGIVSPRIVSNYICVWEEKAISPPPKEDKMKIIEQKYNWAYPATSRRKTTHLVLHHVGTAGSFVPEQIHQQHLKNGWRGIGYHYYVRRDGAIFRGREEFATGGHTLKYNEVAIGICFEGNFETEKMGAAQIKAGRELVADVLKRYPTVKVCRHRDLNATACPGRNFPFAEMTKAPEPESGKIFRVQVGAFSNKSGAEILKAELEKQGYKPIIVEGAK